MAKRPNFLFFITDQHRVDYLGCSGHPVLKTPNIDSIAARGTRFTRFYVATPVCMPNRSTLMTGRMPSLHGVRSNGSPLSLQSNTFVDALRAAGYATALVGKSHLQNFSECPAILKRPPARAGRPGARPEFAEARKPAASRRALRPGASRRAGSRARLRHEAAVLRLRARRSVHDARRPGRRPLLRLAQVAAARRRRAARPQEPAAARLRLSAGVPHADPGGALSDRLHRREKLRVARPLRRRRPQQAVLPDDVVSRSASSVHAARPLLVHVPAARTWRCRRASTTATGRWRGRSPGRWRSARAARPTPPSRRRSPSTSARRARRWR